MNRWETKQIRKNLGFVLIEFEEDCFSLLTLFHLSKKHVLVTCNKILLNIIAKITSGTKRDKCDRLGYKVCSQIVYGTKCNFL